MPKKIAKKQDYLTFSGASDTRAEVQPQDRNLGEELYKKNWAEKTIDSFEKTLGVRPKAPKLNLEHKVKVFSLDFDKDVSLFNKLMNDPRYKIIYQKDNWTVEGLYKMAVIYTENLDYKSPEQVVKDIAEGK